MSDCNIGSLAAYRKGCKTIGGISEILIADWQDFKDSEVAGELAVTNGALIIPSQIWTTKADFYKWELNQNSANYTEPFADDNTAGSTSLTQTLNVVMHNQDAALVNLSEKIRRGRFVAIILFRNGKKRLAGIEIGLQSGGSDGFVSGQGENDAQSLTLNLTSVTDFAAPFIDAANYTELLTAINVLAVQSV